MRHTPLMTKVAAPCAALLAAALWLLPALAQDSPSPSTEFQSTEPKVLSVTFQHNEHNKKAKLVKCVTCHHQLPGAKHAPGKKAPARNMTERRCADCHKPRPGANDFAASLMVASHKLCQDCHKAQGKGPMACSGCHKS